MSARLLAWFLTAAAIAGCGGDSDPPRAATTAQTTPDGPAETTTAAGERPVDDREALILARLLNRNFQDGGARVRGSVPFPQGVQVSVAGQLNWRGPGGRLIFRNPAERGPKASKEVYWTKRAVYEQAAPGARRFTRRAPNPRGSVFDFYLALLSRTSSVTIDNIATLKEQGAAYVRDDRIGAETVTVFRYGAGGRSTYWVSPTGELRRLEVRIADLDERTARFDFDRRGPVRISLPPVS